MSPSENAKKLSLDRREFVKVGSLAAVGLALQPGLLHAAVGATALPILSVGYSDSVPEVAGQSFHLRAAKDLLFGDPSFLSRSARIRIGTFSRATRFANLPGGVDVDVVFPSYGFEPDAYPRVQAWGFRRDGWMQSTSGSLSMTVPVTSTEGLQMFFHRPAAASRGRAVRTGAQPAAATSSSMLRLDTGVTSNVLKLQRGAYVVALRETDDEREPNWGAQILSRDQSGLLLNSLATFTYLIVTVDYAA
jgi:hypothetical protein